MSRLICTYFTMLWIAGLFSGCAPIPILPKEYTHENAEQPGMFEHTVSRDKVTDLLEQSASRDKVIATLGRPLRYRKQEVVYEACRDEGGVIILVGVVPYYPAAVGAFSAFGNEGLKCNELVLTFNEKNSLEGIRETSRKWEFNEYAEDMTLRELGRQGDLIAQKLWEKTRTFYTSQETQIVRERESRENRFNIQLKELREDVKKRAESGDAEAQIQLYMLDERVSLKWLCRAADQGHINAEILLGYHYETGSYGSPRDYARSYLWYRRAALGGHQKEIEALIEKIEKKWPKLYFCRELSCNIANKIVELRHRLDSEVLARAELMLDQWQPGQCEHALVPSNSVK